MSPVLASVAVKGVSMFAPAAVFSAMEGVVFNPMLNTGALLSSTVTVNISDSVFWFSAASLAAPAGTEITTSPLVAGVIVAVYSLAFSIVKSVRAVVAVLSVSEMSLCANPITFSLNVMVTSNALAAVVGAVIVTLGCTLSNWMGCSDEAVLSILAAFCAAPAGTERVISSSTSSTGVMVAVYVMPFPVKLVTVALTPVPSEMSAAVKPVTDLLKVMVTVNALFCGSVGTP